MSAFSQQAQSALPKARQLTEDTLLNGELDATLVQIESQLVGLRSTLTGQVLELQTGLRTYLARLNTRNGPAPRMPLGSRLKLAGVYAGLGGDRTENRNVDSFELLLNSPSDIVVLKRPSWWTPQHAVTAVGTLVFGLLLATAWIMALRRRVELRTRQLKDEIEQHKRTESRLAEEVEERKRAQNELEEKKVSLEKEIEDRKRMELEVEKTHRQLVIASRQAGMAEVATSVLHNVGNVLNSVNVSTTLVVEGLTKSKVSSITRLGQLLAQNADNLAAFVTGEAGGRQLPGYVNQLAEHLNNERSTLLKECDLIRTNIEHIKNIVAMQQNDAKAFGALEKVKVTDMIEDALRLNAGALTRHQVEVVRDYEAPDCIITVETHKVLQILVNLIGNAKHACDESGRGDKRLTIRSSNGKDRVRIEVADNGVGIPAENLTRIFGQGFTTRKYGHGFGLHSAAIAAKEMGGSIVARSDGPQRGAAFTLELPLSPPNNSKQKISCPEPIIAS